MLSRTENESPHFQTFHQPLIRSKINTTDAEMIFFPPYHTPIVEPSASTTTTAPPPPSLANKANNNNNNDVQNQSSSKSKIPVDWSWTNPGLYAEEGIPKIEPKFGPQKSNKFIKNSITIPLQNSRLYSASNTSKTKKKDEQSRNKVNSPRSKKQLATIPPPPNSFAYAKNFAGTVNQKQSEQRPGSLSKKKTEIVLSPRFGPPILQTSSTMQNRKKSIPGTKREIWSRPSHNEQQQQYRNNYVNNNITNSAYTYKYDQQNDSHDYSSPPSQQQQPQRQPPMVKMPADMFPPEKARWVQLALEKLMINGTITRKQMNTPKFQRKIGTLYDSSLSQRSQKTGSHVKNLILQTWNSEPPNSSPKNNPKKQFPLESSFVNRQKLVHDSSKKEYFGTRKSVSTPNSSTAGDSPRSARSSLKSFSSQISTKRQHPAVEIQRKVSDVLLHTLIKGMMVDDKGKKVKKTVVKEKVDGDNNPVVAAPTMTANTMPYGFLPSMKDQRSVSTNTEIDVDDDWMRLAGVTVAKFSRGKSTANTGTTARVENVEDLTAPWIGSSRVVEEPAQDIKNCFVFEGKVCPLMDTSKKPVSTFAPISESRRSLYPTTDGYFRKLVDVRGFDSRDIAIKYSKTRIFIEAKQLAAEDKNYRLVREIIVLPRQLRITDMKVMRGKNNGRLVFEQQLSSFEDSGVP